MSTTNAPTGKGNKPEHTDHHIAVDNLYPIRTINIPNSLGGNQRDTDLIKGLEKMKEESHRTGSNIAKVSSFSVPFYDDKQFPTYEKPSTYIYIYIYIH